MISQKYSAAQATLAAAKLENDKLSTRLKNSEKEVDELQVKVDSQQKQSDITRTQLNDKIKNLEALLSTEKDLREKWIKKYENEQSVQMQTNVELLRVRSLHQNADMDHKNALINLDTQKEAREALGREHENLLTEASKLKAQNENLQREVYAKMKLLKSSEEQQKALIKMEREEKKKAIEQGKIQLMEQQMVYEDLRGFCMQRHSYTLGLLEQIDNLNTDLLQARDVAGKNKAQITALTREVSLLQKDAAELKSDLSESRIETAVKVQDLEAAATQIESFEQKVRELNSEVMKLVQLRV